MGREYDYDEWFPPVEEDEYFTDDENADLEKEALAVYPSEFTQAVFRMPSEEDGTYQPFSFKGRNHMYRPYDTTARRVLLCCGRQVEKSTMLGNKALTAAALIPALRLLYVSPSATQTKTFSKDRIQEPVQTSPILSAYSEDMISENMMEKQFSNRSQITLRYAFLNANRCRGIRADRLFIDEIQDVIKDNISVIEQCTAHARKELKQYVYAGTPKSLDNTIEYYRANLSTQGEWVVPCSCLGGEGGRRWNILGEKNIGKKGVICDRCGKLLDPQGPDAQWAFQTALSRKTPWESYRISQLMVPLKEWEELLIEYETTDRDRFYNEVLGISYDSGHRPLTRSQLIEASGKHRIDKKTLKKYARGSWTNPIYMGIDWGYGQGSYTVVTLSTYVDNKFTVIYMHRFTGEDVEPDPQIKKIFEIVDYFNVRMIGCDWGAGFVQYDQLLRRYGKHRVRRYMHVGRQAAKIVWDGKRTTYKMVRTDVMNDVFNAIKRKQICFPHWDDFADPFAQDMLNIYSEYNHKLHMTKYDHSPGHPDDSFHSVMYSLIVSMLIQPRPDIMAPNREDKHVGRVNAIQTETVSQG